MNSRISSRLINALLIAGLGGSAASSFAGETLRYDDGSAVEAAAFPGSRWETTVFPKQHAAEFRLVRADGSRTNVFYRFDLQYGLELASDPVEAKSFLLIPRPGRTLWEAHPVQNRNLEKKFLGEAAEVYGRLEDRRPFEVDAQGRLGNIRVRVRSVRTDLHELRGRPKVKGEAEMLSFLRAEVTEGWKKILQLRFGASLPAWVIALVRPFDPIEPSIHREGPGESRFDAFSLDPARVYQDSPRIFRAVLDESLAETRWDPIRSILRESDSGRRRARIALLELVTHNHVGEGNLIRLALAGRSPEEAWALMEKTNRLYARIRSPEIPEDGIRHFAGCGGAAPIDLPEKKAYHYLGAWALALRIDEKFKWLPRFARDALLRYATESYLLLTGSDDERRTTLRKYYESALTHFESCRGSGASDAGRIWN